MKFENIEVGNLKVGGIYKKKDLDVTFATNKQRTFKILKMKRIRNINRNFIAITVRCLENDKEMTTRKEILRGAISCPSVKAAMLRNHKS